MWSEKYDTTLYDILYYSDCNLQYKAETTMQGSTTVECALDAYSVQE